MVWLLVMSFLRVWLPCIHIKLPFKKKKKNEIMPFVATRMDLEIIILSEVSQKQIPCDITYMWNLKYETNELMDETEIDSQT